MEKLFEDFFSELQADMVSVCLEYIESRAEKLYICCSFEGNVVSSNFFYKINGKVLKKNKVNNEISAGENPFDISVDRQRATMTIINENIKKLIELCKKYQRDMPTQMKLVYDVKSNSLNADYQYIPMYSAHDTRTFTDIVEAWIQEIELAKR